jgi:BirA family biotin operon repressor/biotin-[acetyl-CoA-carboxylase] ligase
MLPLKNNYFNMKTLFTGQNIIHLKSVDSTNSYAAELLRQNKQQEGTLVCSFNQIAGRGQRGNKWLSEPNKNATFSIVLYPSFIQPDKQFLLTKVISLAVADLMTELLNVAANSHVVKVKWPNDIYVGDKKIAGILIENTLSEGAIKSSIVGIGINVNQTQFDGDFTATSLALLTKMEYDLMQIVEKACEYIEARYLQLKAGKKQNIDAAYLNALYQFGENKKYLLADERIIEGQIEGVSTEGKLQILIEGEGIKEFALQEIRFYKK